MIFLLYYLKILKLLPNFYLNFYMNTFKENNHFHLIVVCLGVFCDGFLRSNFSLYVGNKIFLRIVRNRLFNKNAIKLKFYIYKLFSLLSIYSSKNFKLF